MDACNRVYLPTPVQRGIHRGDIIIRCTCTIKGMASVFVRGRYRIPESGGGGVSGTVKY